MGTFRTKLLKITALVTVLGAFGAFTTGCSKSQSADASASGSSLTISGKLGTISASSLNKLSEQSLVVAQSVSASDLEVYGLAFASTPEVSTVDVGTDGSFSISFSAATAAEDPEVSLIFRYKTGTAKAGTQVGVVKFQDTSEKDMSGNASSSTSIPLTGAVDLGNLSMDANGDVVVDVSTISTSVASTTVDSSTAFDFTGTWQFADYDGTVPEGYTAMCAQGASNCDGPQIGMPIYFRRIAGKSFTPDSTCAAAVSGDTFDPNTGTCIGTTGSEDRFALQVWLSDTAAQTCGGGASQYKLGFNNEAAKAFAQVDFSGQSATTTDFFSWTSGYTDGWKDTANAISQHQIDDCNPVEVTLADGVTKMPGWKCTDSNLNYNIGTQGGCKDTNGDPVNVDDWGNITEANNSSVAAAGYPAGYYTDTKTYTNQDPDGAGPLAAMNFTCDFISGNFDSDGAVDGTDTAGDSSAGTSFDYNLVNQLVAQNGACSGINTSTDAGKIAQLRCYADFLWQTGVEQNENLCVRHVDMDWSATDPAKFLLQNDGPPRPVT